MSRRARVLPRSVTATVTQHSFDGRSHRDRFWRYIARHRPLPPGFRRGLTPKPWTVKL